MLGLGLEVGLKPWGACPASPHLQHALTPTTWLWGCCIKPHHYTLYLLGYHMQGSQANAHWVVRMLAKTAESKGTH